MGSANIANLTGSSQTAGTLVPQHVIVVDADGNLMDFQGGATVWTASHVPAVNTVATVTKATAGAGVRNICTGFTVTLAANTTAPSAVQVTVSLIDGSAGGTTYLWRTQITIPATAGAITGFVRSGIWLPGTANTAMTLEFSAAGGANTFESVSMDGTTGA